jgi:amidase
VRAAGLVRPRTAERFRERMTAFFEGSGEVLDLLLTRS